MFSSLEDVQRRFDQHDYLCSREVATVIFLSLKLQKPLLVEGPAGVGKTELAKVIAEAQGLELIRLQCYEGLDESKALYEWEYAKQVLYTQILKEKIGHELQSCTSLREAVEQIAAQEDAFFSPRCILPRPLLKAIRSPEPTVLLIDEIDKADPEFEAFLLEVLSDFQVSVPEIGTLRATHIPQVVLTSNATREISEGLKRRCVHLFMDVPSPEQEAQIVIRKVPGIDKTLVQRIVTTVARIRALDVRKPPSISETLDWARSLVILNADKLDVTILQATLNLLIKYQEDREKVSKELPRLLQ